MKTLYLCQDKEMNLYPCFGRTADSPHSMIAGPCLWLSRWYENSGFFKTPMEESHRRTVPFPYGDSHPIFSSKVTDGREHRKSDKPMKKF